MNPKIQYDIYVARVNHALQYYFPMLPGSAVQLYEAAHYSLTAGGKRLRPVLLLECARIFGCPFEDAMPFACAIEMIHTYSLVHDDLPCMDNDSLRRGVPTNHVVFGEAMALLAGDTLLTEAFEVMLDPENRPNINPHTRLRAAHTVARAAGSSGMAGGQMIDIASAGNGMALDQIVHMHLMKTGALLMGAAETGAVLAGASEAQTQAVQSYARLLAIAFQARDDLLDATGSPQEMGKQTGSDAAIGKSTLYTVLGTEKCEAFVRGLSEKAKEIARTLPDGDFLEWLADSLSERTS
jgi:geranylgeranyl diphosphate synthase type II